MVKSLRKRMCCNIFLTFDFIPAALPPSCPSLGQPGHSQGRCPGCPSAARAAQVRPTAPSTPDVRSVEGNVAAATSHTCAPRRHHRAAAAALALASHMCAAPRTLAWCSAIAGPLQGCCLSHICATPRALAHCSAIAGPLQGYRLLHYTIVLDILYVQNWYLNQPLPWQFYFTVYCYISKLQQ